MHPAVEMSGITKTFGGKVIANNSIDFSAAKGEIHALVGENGAGKTTLMKILYGMLTPDSGLIKINGNQESITSPSKAISLGIGMVHQHFMLVNPLTVLDNIILGDEDTRFGGVLNRKLSQKKVKNLTADYNINVSTNEKVVNLSVSLQQKVEILKILYRSAGILILDEPTAVLTPQETRGLFQTLRELKSAGKTIILITHKLGEVMEVSDSVTVLRQGKVTGDLKTSGTTKEIIAGLMVGEDYKHTHEKSIQKEGEELLKVKNLSVTGSSGIETVSNVTFSIMKGEIFGIAGVEGNGQKELVEVLSALRKADKGSVKFGDTQLENLQIAHIPADRHRDGIVMDFSVADNMILGLQDEKIFSKTLVLDETAVKYFSQKLIKKFDIRPENYNLKIKELSGGNQQKVVAARELSKDTDFIIANHPTRGLDIKATDFVQQSLLAAREQGKAVLLISSDLAELLKLSDRIGVMFKGKISAVLDANKTDETELGLYMTGVKSENV